MKMTLTLGLLVFLMADVVTSSQWLGLTAYSYPENLYEPHSRSEAYMRIKCPRREIRRFPFFLTCAINVTRMSDIGCVHHTGFGPRRIYYLVVEQFTTNDDSPEPSDPPLVFTSRCNLRVNNRRRDQPALENECQHSSQQRNAMKAEVKFSYNVTYSMFIRMKTRCSVQCPSGRGPVGSYNRCHTTFVKAWSSDSVERHTGSLEVRMDCPGPVRNLPMAVKCRINVTQFLQQTCGILRNGPVNYISVHEEMSQSTAPSRRSYNGRVCYIRTFFAGQQEVPPYHECQSVVDESDHHIFEVSFPYDERQSIYGTMFTRCSVSCTTTESPQQKRSTNFCRTDYMLNSYRERDVLPSNDDDDGVAMSCPRYIDTNNETFTLYCEVNLRVMWGKGCYDPLSVAEGATAYYCREGLILENSTCNCPGCTIKGPFAYFAFPVQSRQALARGTISRTCHVFNCPVTEQGRTRPPTGECILYFPGVHEEEPTVLPPRRPPLSPR